mgnify:CR=1 FL=1
MDHVIVQGEFRVPAERMAGARPLMQALIAATRAEAGCLLYSFAEDLCDPGLIRISERWESRAALAAHIDQPHMAQWASQRADLGVTGRKVSILGVSGEEIL